MAIVEMDFASGEVGKGLEGILSCPSAGGNSGSQMTFNAEIDAYYLLWVNNGSTMSGNMCTSGAEAISPVFQDNYGGRCAVVQIIKATSTTIKTQVNYTFYARLYIE